jgi:hypothetical protein
MSIGAVYRAGGAAGRLSSQSWTHPMASLRNYNCKAEKIQYPNPEIWDIYILVDAPPPGRFVVSFLDGFGQNLDLFLMPKRGQSFR